MPVTGELAKWWSNQAAELAKKAPTALSHALEAITAYAVANVKLRTQLEVEQRANRELVEDLRKVRAELEDLRSNPPRWRDVSPKAAP
jgi:hypothetical protein